MPKSTDREEETEPSYSISSDSAAILKRIEQVSVRQMYPATVEIFRQGSRATDLYFPESGLIKLVRIERDGRALVFDLRFPGDLLGNFSSIIDRPYPLTAITVVNSVVLRIPASLFRELLQNDIELSWHLHKIHCRIAIDNVFRFTQLTLTTARQRLEQLLWKLIAMQEPGSGAKNLWLKVPLRYWEIAALIAVSPAYLSRLFGELEREGIIQRKNGRLILRDPQKLWHEQEL